MALRSGNTVVSSGISSPLQHFVHNSRFGDLWANGSRRNFPYCNIKFRLNVMKRIQLCNRILMKLFLADGTWRGRLLSKARVVRAPQNGRRGASRYSARPENSVRATNGAVSEIPLENVRRRSERSTRRHQRQAVEACFLCRGAEMHQWCFRTNRARYWSAEHPVKLFFQERHHGRPNSEISLQSMQQAQLGCPIVRRLASAV